MKNKDFNQIAIRNIHEGMCPVCKKAWKRCPHTWDNIDKWVAGMQNSKEEKRIKTLIDTRLKELGLISR